MSTKTQKGARSGRKANVQETPQAAPETKVEPMADPTAQDAPVAPESAQVSKPRGKRAKGEATLQDVADGYLAHLEDAGKSEGTCFSYRMDLKAALDHFGADTAVATLTPAKVANFFASDGVTKKRNGRKKSSITIAKTCRVFRLALVWAAEKGMIEKAPIPQDELQHARGAVKAEAKETAKPTRTKKATAKKAADATATEPAPEATAAAPTTAPPTE